MKEIRQQPEQSATLKRTIGLIDTTAIVVGGVIGMGIFVLIAPMAALAGETLWLVITIALVLSMAGALPLIQLASALPRAGGGYFFVSRMFSPYPAMLTSNWGILGGVFSSIMVTKGLSSYVIEQIGIDFSPDAAGALVLVLLYVIYRFGLRLAMQIQVVLVIQLLVALGIYASVGTFNYGIAMSFDMPRGSGDFFMAVVLAYSLSMGTQVLAEIGEEVHNARRTIPLSLCIGGSIILLVYVLVSGVFLRAIPYDYDRYQSMQAPLAESASLFLGSPALIFLNVAAISAGLTSLNAAAGSLPREFFAQARDGILPAWFGRIHAPTGTPMNAVTAYFLLSIVLMLSPLSIAFCGYMVAVGIMMLSIPVSMAALRLHKKYPDRYRTAYVRFPLPLLRICTILSVVCSAGFILLIALETPLVLLLYGIWTLIISGIYAYRKQILRQQGIDISQIAKNIPGADE